MEIIYKYNKYTFHIIIQITLSEKIYDLQMLDCEQIKYSAHARAGQNIWQQRVTCVVEYTNMHCKCVICELDWDSRFSLLS